MSAGHGIGVRGVHYGDYLEHGLLAVPGIDHQPPEWVEIITENVLRRGGRPAAVLERVRRDAGVLLHGVSLSIGGPDPLDLDYLRSLRTLADRLDVALVSDHLCWGTFGGKHSHDLWPLPYTQEAVHHVAARVRQAQDLLGRELVLENVSSYVQFADSEMSEWEFVSAVCEEADCGLLFDVNNVYVSSRNHGFDPLDYFDGVPAHRVRQYHLAGHADKGGWLLDDHAHPIPDAVMALYREAIRRFGSHPAILEWDQDVPPLAELLGESHRARVVEMGVLQ